MPRGLLVGSAAAFALVAAALTLSTPQPSTRKALPEFSLPGPVPAVLNVAPQDDKPLRLVYRNSIVPGGVHSAAELAAVIKRDPIAAAHYGNFNVAAAHLVRVEQSRMVHVSYRIGNQIYWTKNKVRLALGEYLLSDGEHLIRARCGNRIADTVQGPVLLNEPAPEILETAFVSAGDLIDQTVSMAALGGMPIPPVPGSSTAAMVTATPAPAFRGYADRFGMPALVSIPTLPGVTVIGTRPTAPALVDGGSATDPVVTTPVTTPPAATVPATEPVAPVPAVADPAATAPVVTVPVVTAPVTTDPVVVKPVAEPAAPLLPVPDSVPVPTPAPPIDIKTELPVSSTPEAPFIETPTFTPTPPLVSTTDDSGTVPEPGSLLLAAMALVMLFIAHRLRRSQR
ncbi:hypothetical protein [Massilia sp. DWR3-1-1]|uniref:hypothetical protein n=1 Tax=Massilia sp. DWR3-1-1 TaxID=2804559 RepID=UPI003CEDD82E